MIAAQRYADRSRTLEPPPRLPEGAPFAHTWWGTAWLDSWEDSAADGARLARGRGYARGGSVGAVTVAPGRAVAYVRGSRPRPYRVSLHLRELTEGEWDAFLDAVAAEPAHIAALLDRDMPRTLAAAAEAAGLDLLPAAGELAPACTCPDAGRPCKHAAALGYEMARHLDDDPFVLFLLRGRGESELLDELARRSAAQAAGRPQPAGLPTVPARRVFAEPSRPPLPDPLPVPDEPGHARPFPPDETAERPAPRGAGPRRRAPRGPAGPTDPDSLDFLVTDAAARAHAHLTGAGPEPLTGLPARQDAVRLAATHPHLAGRGTFSAQFARLAEGTGTTVTGLACAAAAWRHGGPAGLDALESAWDPPAGDFDRARSLLSAGGFPRTTIDRNRLTAGAVQLRYGRDGRWYPYRADPRRGDFWPAGAPDPDPVRALHTALHG